MVWLDVETWWRPKHTTLKANEEAKHLVEVGAAALSLFTSPNINQSVKILLLLICWSQFGNHRPIAMQRQRPKWEDWQKITVRL